jgi:hypothetical protein
MVGVEVIKGSGVGDLRGWTNWTSSRSRVYSRAVLEGLSRVVAGALAEAGHCGWASTSRCKSGKLTGVLVQAGGRASLKISLCCEGAASRGPEAAPAESADEETIEQGTRTCIATTPARCCSLPPRRLRWRPCGLYGESWPA